MRTQATLKQDSKVRKQQITVSLILENNEDNKHQAICNLHLHSGIPPFFCHNTHSDLQWCQTFMLLCPNPILRK